MADINLTDMKDILNLNSSINAMPPELVSKFANLITIFKTVGIIFIIYIIFLIAKSIFGIIRNKRIDKMYHKINEIIDKEIPSDTKEETSVKSDKIKQKPKK